MPKQRGAARRLLADVHGQRMARLRTAIGSSNFAARLWPNSTKLREFTSSIGITHSLGSVHLNGGYLHLDSGELEHADSEARTAFHLGEEKGDYILMARARLLDCMIENGRVEEEIGDGGEAGSHARLAQDCTQEAVELARHTQNRRLLADACIWQGLTYCNRFLDDPESARRCYDEAIALAKESHTDGSWEDLETLKTKVLRGGRVNPMLLRLVARIRR